MYIRKDHEEDSIPALRAFIRSNPLGLFTTAIDSDTHHFLQSSHIPFVLDVSDESSPAELGRLRGHLARMNPQSKAIIEETTKSDNPYLERDVLIIFNSENHHYVTPKWYVETKPATGKVVPTWNYSAVQVYGKARVYVDSKAAETGEWLGTQIHDLSEHNERNTMGHTGDGTRPMPWKVADAPENYIDLLKKAIIGVEIEITRLEGKHKMSQEMPEGDVKGVAEGMKKAGSERATAVGNLVDERFEIKVAKKAAASS